MARRSLILIGLVLALVVAACGGGGSASTTEATSAVTSVETTGAATTSAETTAATTAVTSAEGPIKIGILADLTGPFTTYGNSLSRSAQLAINDDQRR